ncbi:protein of unknown function DUF82 [Solidesulfovibrio fructosivorans JJ]]|uniref:Twitching motility protein PilT n=1 Tax=Solidesulfovibrio fructosivorans JJ] TaxID=596151 RepID=E1JVB7_SOLFR|nr:Mut7-C RNAse domain-containing protein [Solidesulfovibrio fructosivorans]EFL51711.1 protein of unknown function DUF82 [Solidesulfovibrio fructosivorans JJ]]
MDKAATLRFRGALRELLRRPAANGVVVYPVTREASIKDVIEALGPPHTEIHGIIADDRPVGFEHRLAPGERITIEPAVFPIDVFTPTLLRPTPLPLPKQRFVADANVGRLATLLRLLGYDAVYDRDMEDGELARIAAEEGRIALSRDVSCLKRSKIMYGRLIRANDPQEQLRDILRAFGLTPPYGAFTRCLRCNRELAPVDKKDILDRLLPKTKRYYEKFSMCPECGRIYWAGSHYEHMRGWIREILKGEETISR